MLSPLNELALKADELSKLEFGEDKYQLIEDAISHLDAGEGSTLSLGDRDLLGVEAAINNLLLRVRESNKQQARFVNDASHELRTPIAVISGYADMLARWGRDDEKVLDESITAIQKESTRMKHLVEQLLFLARGDSGRTALKLEQTDLRDLMREAYEESVMIDENHVYKFNAQADAGGTGLTVYADPGMLKQAVRILIDNAAKYTKEHDEILLGVGISGGHPYLQVQDYTDVHAVDRMSFELTRTEDDLMQAIAKALGKELSSSDSETIGSLSRFLRIRLGDIKGIYKISGELSEKVTDAINAFYAYVVFDILFIEFEGYMVMIVFGSDE